MHPHFLKVLKENKQNGSKKYGHSASLTAQSRLKYSSIIIHRLKAP